MAQKPVKPQRKKAKASDKERASAREKVKDKGILKYRDQIKKSLPKGK